MSLPARILTILTILMATIVGRGPAAPFPGEGLTVHGASEAQVELLDQAIALFEETGRDLPALDVAFHDDREACGGIHGDFTYRDGFAVVNICNPTFHIIVHELGHAWVSHNVDDGTREQFMLDLDLVAWNDPDVAWADRGTERAANTVALVLNWQPDSVSDPRALTRLCGYETLTGASIPDSVPVECPA